MVIPLRFPFRGGLRARWQRLHASSQGAHSARPYILHQLEHTRWRHMGTMLPHFGGQRSVHHRRRQVHCPLERRTRITPRGDSMDEERPVHHRHKLGAG
jgi:hypothetical protein